MALREGFGIEDVQRGAFDALSGQRAHHRGFVDHGAAAYVDYYRSGLHRLKFGLANHAASLGRQGRRGHDVIRLSEHFRTFVRREDLVNQRIHVVQ